MGDWKVARTRRLESLRYVAQTFLSAGAGDFPVPGSVHRPLTTVLKAIYAWSRMTTPQLIFFGVFEVIALLVVARMWIKRWHRRLIVRIVWSAVLLVPVFGVLAYFFLRENPDSHPEYIEEFGPGANNYTGSDRGVDGH